MTRPLPATELFTSVASPLYSTSPLPGSALSQKIGPLDLRGKRSLTLHVEFGELGDIQDHADWCDPVLVRAKGSESPARD